jgi:CheY-like chemotaxis protein
MADFTLLIVDDELSIREGLGRLAKSLGIRVLLAENGSIGVEMAQIENPDLMILDLGMPIMTGFEVLEWLSQLGLSIPTVIMTAYGTDTNVELVKLSSKNPNIKILHKPAAPQDVLALVREAIAQKL